MHQPFIVKGKKMTDKDYSKLQWLENLGIINADDVQLVRELAELHPELILTGSACWGAANPKDVDVMCIAHRSDIPYSDIPGQDKLSATRNENPGSLDSITFKGRKINVICLTEEGYQLWSRATQMMRCLPYIEDKATRLGVFQTLRGMARIALKYTVGASVNLD